MRTILSATLALGFLLSVHGHAQVGTNQNLVNPNLAEASELRALPHMTDALVDAIIEARPILRPSELDAVLAGSLSAEQRTEVYGRLFRALNLNDTNEAEIMLIPEMTDRMAYEFDEYAPYENMAEFRQEIGKYVDDAEVARLEQYVFVPMGLNEGSDDDYMTIPGMTSRMVREFHEYRPWTSQEQFQREIGKYVDEAEVARLWSYVRID